MVKSLIVIIVIYLSMIYGMSSVKKFADEMSARNTDTISIIQQ